MDIGGQDILIEIPADILPSDIIINLMRLEWPTAYFQDADQEDSYPIDSEIVMIQGVRSREFFVFLNEESAEAWNREGATSENFNSMLHFLIDDRPVTQGSARHVTLVSDEVTEPIESLVANLKERFRGATKLHGLPTGHVG